MTAAFQCVSVPVAERSPETVDPTSVQISSVW
jgi:hypothetical protein